MTDFGLGRKPSEDSKDKLFLMRSLLPRKIPTGSKYWYASGWYGDQGSLPHCVGYAWTHWLSAGPVTNKVNDSLPQAIYTRAQDVDEWPGNNYYGTSVRAGAKAAQEAGYIDSYYWAWDLNTALEALLTIGPVVIGVNWYSSMFFPTDKYFLEIKGRIEGGHAVLLDGINTKEEKVRIKNSWGKSWGNKGFAYLKFKDLERLISEDGEVCLATELKK